MPPETVVLLEECDEQKAKTGKTMKFTFQPESKPLEGYTIKRAIHRGGFGEVYYALSDAGKEVALKLLRQHLDVELRGVTQCLNLKHPNLVTIFDIRTDADGDHWVVMEYVSGKSLNHVLEQHSHGMPIDDVERWLAGLAEGMSFLHDRGIVHRDLKPANIFIENGVVKIGDVGLSKFISESHRSAQTQSVGTVYYMAPEVAHGRYGREVDIYSMGVMLYELLTGRVPFVGESAGEILMKHLSERPDLSAIPMRLRSVLAQVLEKDPLRRTPTAARLLEDFRKAIRGFDIPRDIPEDSFIQETIPDSSAPKQAQVPPEFKLKDQIARDAHEAVRHAKKAAKQARQWAKEIQQAAKRGGVDRPPSQHEAASRNHHRPNGWRAVGPHAGEGHPYQESFWTSPKYFWWRIGSVMLLIFVFRRFFAVGFQVGVGIFEFLVIAGILTAMAWGIFRLIAYVAVPGHPRKFESPNYDVPNAGSSEAAHPASQRIVKEAMHGITPPPARPRRPVILNPNTRRTISWRQRMAELSGSLALAGVCTVLITFGLMAFLDNHPTGALTGFFAATTLLAAWGILTVGKLLEGSDVEPMTRRALFFGLGLLIGLAAYSLDQFLLIDSSTRGSFSVDGAGRITDYVFNDFGPYTLRDDHRQPTMAAYLVFFGGLFAFRRWWWHTDSFRARRFGLIPVMGTSLLALVLVSVWMFPQFWAVTWAAAISSVVQLSAAWVPPRERAALMEVQPHA
jgi:eukaryotic-like serine/threonine-protein kinase